MDDKNTQSAPDFIPDTAPDFIPDQPGLTPVGTNKAGFPTYHGSPAPIPGFISRTSEALGIPTSAELSQPVSPGEFAGHAILGPAFTAGQAAYGYAKNAINGLTEPVPAEDEARYAAHPMARVPDIASKYLLEKLLAPVGGQAVSNIANDKGNLGAQAGDVAGTIGNVALMRMAKEPKTAARIAYATGGDAKDVLTAEKDLMDAVGTHGVPKDLPELTDRIDKAKSALNQEYANSLGPYANMQTMPSGVSQRILKLITPNLDMTQPGRVMKKQLQSAALEFQKPWTMAQLDQERMDANARLHAFNNKDVVDQYAATRGNNRNPAIDNAIANGVRETVYPQLDQLTGTACRVSCRPEGSHRCASESVERCSEESCQAQYQISSDGGNVPP